MLLFKGPRDQFLMPLQAVCGIVEKRHTLPILSNVLIEQSDGMLKLLATDIEMQIRATAASESIEQVAVTVAARKLQDILRSLPDEAEVSLNVDERRLQVKSGKSRFNLQTLPAEDFPRMSEATGELVTLTLTQKKLKRLLSQVQYAMAQQDIRYYLNGLLMVAQGGELRFVATDGHRLAYASEPMQESAQQKRIEAILPRKTILEVSRQLADNDEALELSLSASQARFRFGTVEFMSKLIDGKFPDHERVIPRNLDKLIVLDRALLQHSLQRAAILTNEKFRGIRLLLAPGSLKIISSNTDNEEALEEIEIDYKGVELDVGFNVNYLLDVLNNIPAEKIEIRLGESNSSALITLPDNDGFKYVVMPLRI